ncbi:Amidohydrolase family [Chromobacterium violaceum]|uniref:Amidohydrolase family n=1 Tax=Chromobacterium violaceum TaxID=536 RepID=A0A447TEP4_CHRVL|nr:Amidohydrolase family [Chromobacterium violaceum]
MPDVPPIGLFNFKIPDAPSPENENRLPDSLASYLHLALGSGWPVLVHSNGEQAMELVLDSYQEAISATRADARHLRLRVEHASLLTDATLSRMASMGLSPSFLIGHVGYWGYALQNDILAKRAPSCWTAVNRRVTPVFASAFIPTTSSRPGLAADGGAGDLPQDGRRAARGKARAEQRRMSQP